MIYFLFGENTYVRDEAVREILGDIEFEKFDGELLELRNLPDIFAGQTLFSAARNLLIKNLSERTDMWAEIEPYIGAIDDATTLVLVEDKPDKRTKTFKTLKKVADTREFLLFKNQSEAVKFLEQQAKKRSITLSSTLARHVVQRAGMDGQQLMRALEKLELLDVVTADKIDELITQTTETQVFGLFEAALARKTGVVHSQTTDLRLHENPHRAYAFLASQTMQFAAIALAKPDANVAHDLGAHPFVIQKLTPLARAASRHDVHEIAHIIARCDDQMKSSGSEPWDLIESSLLTIAARP